MAAQWQATVLSFEMGSLGKSSPPEGITMLRGAARGRRVSFADEAVIHIYSEFGAWRPIPIDLTELSLWKAKPWTLNCAPATSPFVQETDVSDSDCLDYIEPSCLARDVQYETWLPGFPFDERPALSLMPAWVQQTWQGIFNQQAEIEFQDEGPVLYLLTWFLHPAGHRLCTRPRTAKLDLYYEHWEADLRQLWLDVVHYDEDLAAFIVFPEPPRTTAAMHSGHLILTQGNTNPQRAILISTLESNLMENHLTQVAVLAPQMVNKFVIQQLSQVPAHILSRGVECWMDETWIADDGPGVPVHDGCHVLQYIEHVGVGPRHTWQPQQQVDSEDDSDVAALIDISMGLPRSNKNPNSFAVFDLQNHVQVLHTDGRCGDLLSPSEAVLNSPASVMKDDMSMAEYEGLRQPDLVRQPIDLEDHCTEELSPGHSLAPCSNTLSPLLPTTWSQLEDLTTDRPDDTSFMQIDLVSPCSRKDTPDTPPWYQNMQDHMQVPEDQASESQQESGFDSRQSSEGHDSPADPGTPDWRDEPDEPPEDPDPPSPHPPPEDPHRQNVMLFLRGQAPIHAYIVHGMIMMLCYRK